MKPSLRSGDRGVHKALYWAPTGQGLHACVREARKRTSMTVSSAVAQPAPYNHDLAKEWPADHVERRSVASLIPYARNARTHSDTQISQLAASIREWGWTMPVLIDEAGGIIAGHGRVLAARMLGLHDVPVMTALPLPYCWGALVE